MNMPDERLYLACKKNKPSNQLLKLSHGLRKSRCVSCLGSGVCPHLNGDASSCKKCNIKSYLRNYYQE